LFSVVARFHDRIGATATGFHYLQATNKFSRVNN